MKKLILSTLLIGFFSHAAQKAQPTEISVLDLMPIQTQIRYEDTTEQSRQAQTYKNFIEFNAAYQYSNYRLSLGHSYQSVSGGGNQTLSIENSKNEYLMGLGYQFLQLSSAQKKLSLSLFANGFLGISQSVVETKLFGASTKSFSDPDAVYAIGSSAVGRYYFLVLETDFKLLYSNNMSPQIVPALSIRFGFCFYF